MDEPHDKERQLFEERAQDLLNACESIPLASITQNGYPRICEMEVVKTNGFLEIYFTALKKSKKVKHFRANDKASVSFYGDYDSLSLIGHIQIIEDIETKKTIWQGEHERRFAEKSGEPLFCILRFRAIEGRFFVGGVKRTYKYGT